jgi:hypothetical protein
MTIGEQAHVEIINHLDFEKELLSNRVNKKSRT